MLAKFYVGKVLSSLKTGKNSTSEKFQQFHQIFKNIRSEHTMNIPMNQNSKLVGQYF